MDGGQLWNRACREEGSSRWGLSFRLQADTWSYVSGRGLCLSWDQANSQQNPQAAAPRQLCDLQMQIRRKAQLEHLRGEAKREGRRGQRSPGATGWAAVAPCGRSVVHPEPGTVMPSASLLQRHFRRETASTVQELLGYKLGRQTCTSRASFKSGTEDSLERRL